MRLSGHRISVLPSGSVLQTDAWQWRGSRTGSRFIAIVSLPRPEQCTRRIVDRHLLPRATALGIQHGRLLGSLMQE